MLDVRGHVDCILHFDQYRVFYLIRGVLATGMTITLRYHALRAQIQDLMLEHRQGSDSVRLVAVSKRRNLDDMRALIALGQRDFAESYLQEALPKINELGHDLVWHYIGRLQRRKIPAIVQHFDWLHSLTECAMAEKLALNCQSSNKELQVCLQVSLSPGRQGVALDQLPALVDLIAQLPELQWRGLMFMPEPGLSEIQLKAQFQEVATCYQHYRRLQRIDTLSMGMSGDFSLAILLGANMVRIGRGLFEGTF